MKNKNIENINVTLGTRTTVKVVCKALDFDRSNVSRVGGTHWYDSRNYWTLRTGPTTKRTTEIDTTKRVAGGQVTSVLLDPVGLSSYTTVGPQDLDPVKTLPETSRSSLT